MLIYVCTCIPALSEHLLNEQPQLDNYKFVSKIPIFLMKLKREEKFPLVEINKRKISLRR